MKIRTMVVSGLLTVAIAVQSFGTASPGAIVSAANVQQISANEIESVYDLEVDSNTLEGWAQGPKIYSEAGIVMDINSGAILYAKNIDDQHYPASITKVMTALVALENYEMDELVTFTWDDIGFLEMGDAHIGIKPDEQLSMEDCMYGMLLASANEVSHAIGSHMEGGYEEFIRVMNETAKKIGCKNSNWMNTNGLHDPEHYTSVRDMALIGSKVFQYEKFREITNTRQYTISGTNITEETRTFQQNHKMIWSANDNYYEYCVGGKTGYTDQALTTLVTFATKKDANNNDVNLVAVVMRTHGGGQNAYADTRAMLDYAFDNFTRVPITNEMVNNKDIASIDENGYVMLPAGVTVEKLESTFARPVEVGDKTGTITYTYQKQEVGKVNFEITEALYNKIHGIEEKTKEEQEPTEQVVEQEEEKSKLPIFAKVLIGVIIVLGIGIFILSRYVAYKRKQLMRKRRQMRRRQQQRRQYEASRYESNKYYSRDYDLRGRNSKGNNSRRYDSNVYGSNRYNSRRYE